MTDAPARQRNWREAAAVYLRPQAIALLFLGFSAGLPFLLVFSTLSAWLTDAGVSRSAIGFFSWVGITYSVKVFWAPVVDRLPLPLLTRLLGKRRSWMLLAQAGIACGLLVMARLDPAGALQWFALAAVAVAFCSATQDIAIDAYRIECAEQEAQGALSATYIFGYRLALLVAGAGALFIADLWSWEAAYLAMAALMGVGVLTTLAVREPDHEAEGATRPLEERVERFLLRNAHLPAWQKRAGAWLIDAVICPFVDFFQRNGWFALWVLLLIGCYRISDITMGVMANPFYLDLGFSKSEIAGVSKVFGFFLSIAGSFVGGLLVMRYGLAGPLLLGAVLVAGTNLLFALLAQVGPDLRMLAVVISADNLSGGLANAAFIAYLSSLTHRAYTATQYALFSSIMTLPGKFVGGYSGVVVDAAGYAPFFIYAALLGIPAILLAYYVARRPAPAVERVPPAGQGAERK